MTDRAEEGPAIDISHVWFSYNSQEVLRDVSLQVARGEFMAMIGPNGGGKTTPLKIMLGLLEPDQGEARVLGLPSKKAAPRIRHRADTVIGVIWAVGMASGIILIDLSPGYNVDLMSYLFGSILAVPGTECPEAVQTKRNFGSP